MLKCWVEIFEARELNLPFRQIVDISPPPTEEFEIRVIVWSARTSIIKDKLEKCNDLFVKCQLGNDKEQSTDVHARCRDKDA